MNLVVFASAEGWRARFGTNLWRCAVGRGGVRRDKTEGDGATPAGRWPIRRVLYRPDRLDQPVTCFACAPIRPADGWCDDPADGRYNTQIALPTTADHEALWREDEIYDCIAVLGYNDRPPAAGKGSAIFLHVAREDYGPTEGCVALAMDHLLTFLQEAGPGSLVCVETP